MDSQEPRAYRALAQLHKKSVLDSLIVLLLICRIDLLIQLSSRILISNMIFLSNFERLILIFFNTIWPNPKNRWMQSLQFQNWAQSIPMSAQLYKPHESVIVAYTFT